MRARIMALTAAAAAILGVCCGPPPGPCSGVHCLCAGGDACDIECPAVGCDAECHDLDACAATCGDQCALRCHNNTSCDLECGDACDATCESVSACDVGCGEACAVACTSLSSCAVVMISGEVKCTGVGACDVRCALPDGSDAAAEECSAGVYRCPAGAC